MAFFLTPRFAPTYQQCGPYACAPQRPRHVSRPSGPSIVPFLSQIEGLISELDREHAARQQREQRKRAFRARFDVKEHQGVYHVEGEVPGFEQENISIEVTDEHTLKVSGDTEKVEEQVAEPQTTEPETDKIDGLTLNEPEPEVTRPASPTHSETSSHKSYQPTVEDDFEDLGEETSSIRSQSSAPAEPKGKEKAVEDTAVQTQPKSEAPVQQTPQQPEQRHWLSERVHGSFERTFQFPDRIDMANVRASLRNGVLSITVPKAPAFTVRQITIQ